MTAPDSPGIPVSSRIESPSFFSWESLSNKRQVLGEALECLLNRVNDFIKSNKWFQNIAAYVLIPAVALALSVYVIVPLGALVLHAGLYLGALIFHAGVAILPYVITAWVAYMLFDSFMEKTLPGNHPVNRFLNKHIRLLR